MITGSILLDVIAFLTICWAGAIILVPISQWFEYKRDCKKYGKEQAYEIWRRMR